MHQDHTLVNWTTYLASVNCPKFWYIHRLKRFASIVKITKETPVSWNAHRLLTKKGTNYYVVYSITHIKGKKNEHILYCIIFHIKIWGQINKGWYVVSCWGRRWELGGWQTVTGKKRKEAFPRLLFILYVFKLEVCGYMTYSKIEIFLKHLIKAPG